MLIKNGNVVLFKDNDVIVEKLDIRIKDNIIEKSVTY